MSQIAALLLMFMNEEDAFWALSQLLTNQKHAMHGETSLCTHVKRQTKLLLACFHDEVIVKRGNLNVGVIAMELFVFAGR